MASYIINNNDDYQHDNFLFCPMIDARRMEVFTALYDNHLNIIEPVNAKIVDDASYSNYFETNRIFFFGDGSEKCKVLLNDNPNAEFIEVENSAVNLTSLALTKFNANEAEDVAYFEPFYLKEYLIKSPATR